MQLQVTNSPFSQEQVENINRLLPSLTESQINWLAGYLSANQVKAAPLPADSSIENIPGGEVSPQNEDKIISRNVKILFGSDTGNGQTLAEEMFGKLEERDFNVSVSSLDDFKPKNLKNVEDLLIVTSTHGEGDPPDNALNFYEFLNSRRAPKFEDLRFSVLSLGDQSYEFFCQTGKDFDKRLEELGGERLYPRVDCDVDFDEPAADWVEGVLDALRVQQEVILTDEPSQTGVDSLTDKQPPVYSRTHPFKAEVLENLNLNGRGSNKETRHLELSLEGSKFKFEPGDSLGIFPKNDPSLVDRLIDEIGWNPEEPVLINKRGEQSTFRDALLFNFEITRLTKPLLENAARVFENDALSELLKPGHEDELKTYIDGRDLLDLVQDFKPQDISPSEFIQILRKIPARLYSITSGFNANPDEVHLTIGTVRYHAHGRERSGVCSGQCGERAQPGELLPVYIQHNQNFKFPTDSKRPVIMIGPGTGVAPFRSYLEEREESGIEGKTWLFYGDQHFATDFLYQIEWQRWLKEGVLTRMDVAFSRDGPEKVYVQHRMLEKSKDFFQWLKEGASVYVCGDEKYMANDVHTTLLTILMQEGDMSHEEAEVYLNEMRQEKRYQRDIY